MKSFREVHYLNRKIVVMCCESCSVLSFYPDYLCFRKCADHADIVVSTFNLSPWSIARDECNMRSHILSRGREGEQANKPISVDVVGG